MTCEISSNLFFLYMEGTLDFETYAKILLDDVACLRGGLALMKGKIESKIEVRGLNSFKS